MELMFFLDISHIISKCINFAKSFINDILSKLTRHEKSIIH